MRIRGLHMIRRGMFLSITDAATRGATVFAALLIARFFGPAVYGQYSAASAVCGLAVLITAFGYEEEFTRRASLDNDLLWSGLKLNLQTILVTGVLMFAGLAIVGASGIYAPQTMTYIYLLGVTLFLGRLQMPFRHYMLVLGKPELSAYVQAPGTALIVLATAALIFLKQSVWAIIVSGIVINALILLVWWRLLPGERHSAHPSRGALRDFIWRAWPFGLSSIAWTAYFNIGSIMLSLTRSDAEVGIYGAVFRIVGLSYTIAFAMTNAYTPALFASFHARSSEYGHLARRLLALLLVLGIVVDGTLLVFARPIIQLILGDAYVASGVPVAQCLAIAAMVRFLNFGLSEILTTAQLQRWRVGSEIALLVVNIAVTWLLIPRYGAMGAAAGCLAAELVLMACSIVLILKMCPRALQYPAATATTGS
jgi:O-antigen/teichoic acid export membrane protein